jgi:O-antigen ligase
MKQLFLPRWRHLVFWLMLSAMLVAVIVASVVAGLQIANGSGIRQMLPLALPIAVLLIIFTCKYFQMAVLALPLAALAVPFDLSTGTESRVPASMALALLLLLIWCASMSLRGWKLAPSPLNRPLIVFGVICSVSLLWGIAWREPGVIDWSGHFVFVQIAALLAILLSLAAALLIGNFVATPRQLKYVMGLFIAVCCLMLIIRIFSITQPFLTIRGLWALWLVAPAYALLIAQPGVRWYWRALLLLVVVVAFGQVLIEDALWVSGWMPGVIALFTITFLRSRRAFVALVIAAVLVYQTPPVRSFFQTVGQENIDEGALERLSIWEQNWRVVQGHWLFGTGPAGYAIYYMTYYQEDARSTHNNYLDILAQFGFVGMLAWLWLAAASVWEGWQLIQRAPPGFLRTLTITACGGWVGAMGSMMFGDWVLPFAYNQTISGFKYTVYSWIFLGTLISIRQLLPAQAEPVYRQRLWE